MKPTLLLPLRCVKNGTKRIYIGVVLAVAVTFLHQNATAAPIVDLGTASSFAILAGSKITDAGGVSAITGDVGLHPAAGTFLELTAGQVDGTIYRRPDNDVLLDLAKTDLTTAYNDAAGRTPFSILVGTVPAENQLGGRTLFPGVYRFGSATTANLIGTLTLDANGEADPVWIFQATSDLITASDSSVVFKDGVGSSCDVFWQVGSSATIGTGTDFVGHIMADQSIVLQTGATLDGSALARVAAVTLDHNTIINVDCQQEGTGGVSVPDTGSTLLLLGPVLGILLGFRQLFFSPA